MMKVMLVMIKLMMMVTTIHCSISRYSRLPL